MEGLPGDSREAGTRGGGHPSGQESHVQGPARESRAERLRVKKSKELEMRWGRP